MKSDAVSDNGSDAPSVDQLASRAHEAVDTTLDEAQRLTHDAGATLDTASATLRDGLQTAAARLRAEAPGDGAIASAAARVADGLEGAASFLREHPLRTMVAEAAGAVRRRPVQASILGLGLGYLLGRGLSSRKEQ